MRINQLQLENFKGFAQQRLSLHPHFTLLVGDNGAGKTTLLDALAVAAGIWLVEAPDTTLTNSGRNILSSKIRLTTDLAIKAVTQNAFLVPADEPKPADGPLPRVLGKTPGLVLIDGENFSGAREKLRAVEAAIGQDDPEVTQARTFLPGNHLLAAEATGSQVSG